MMGHPLEDSAVFENLFGSGKKKAAPEPATEKQKNFAKTLKVPNPDALTKDQATQQISKKLEARNRRRKGWISHLEGRIEALEEQVGKKPTKKAVKKKKK